MSDETEKYCIKKAVFKKYKCCLNRHRLHPKQTALRETWENMSLQVNNNRQADRYGRQMKC